MDKDVQNELADFLIKHNSFRLFHLNRFKANGFSELYWSYDPTEFICSSFDWSATKEGDKFWRKLAKQWLNFYINYNYHTP